MAKNSVNETVAFCETTTAARPKANITTARSNSFIEFNRTCRRKWPTEATPGNYDFWIRTLDSYGGLRKIDKQLHEAAQFHRTTRYRCPAPCVRRQSRRPPG